MVFKFLFTIKFLINYKNSQKYRFVYFFNTVFCIVFAYENNTKGVNKSVALMGKSYGLQPKDKHIFPA